MANRHDDIVETLCAEIDAGKYASPSPFPSVTRLKQRFGIAHLTAVKVLDTLKKRGLIFSRHGAGSFVRKRQPRRIGVIVSAPPEGEFYPYICNVISHVCRTTGHGVLLADVSACSAKEFRSQMLARARSFVDERVAGVLFRPADFREGDEGTNHEVLDIFGKAGIPVVLLDGGTMMRSFDMVGIDNATAGWQLAEHVFSRGARRMLFAYGEWAIGRNSDNAHQRLLGVRNFVAENHDVSLVGECGIRSRGQRSLSSAMKRLRPDAVICTSDYVAALALKEIAASGRRVPEDVLVTGVNDIGIATLTNPALTTIRQPCTEIAQAAVETLEWRLLNPSAAPRRVFVSAPLVVRESTCFASRAKP